MKKWLKRIRGALGLGLIWAAAWSGVGVMFALLGFLGSLDPIIDYVVVAFFFAIWGFLGGALSSVVLGITEGRRTFDEMSLPRFAAWGARLGFVAIADEGVYRLMKWSPPRVAAQGRG